MLNPLQDAEFLKRLDSVKNRQNYVRITSLDLQDRPRETIEGKVTGGSINVDGASALRRSCQLTLAALPEEQITDYYWVFDTKFKLEIGLKNDIDERYPDIIWFKQGIYIITAFSANKNTNNISISISGQDKMCRLNGEVSGNFLHQTDLGQVETVDDYGNILLTKLTIREIIENMMVEYGHERIENIIINDLDESGYEMWDYKGDTPIYFLIPCNDEDVANGITNMTLDGNTPVWVIPHNETDNEDNYKQKKLSDDAAIKYYSFYTLDPEVNQNASQVFLQDPTITTDAIGYYISQIKYGETAGYHKIPLVFNTDLIANVGETVVSVLDKIKQMLVNFEYFYDLDGRFVFQKKKTYQQEFFSPINGKQADPIAIITPYSYIFDDESKFTSISNPPVLKNLKNDFSVWGTRKSASGQSIPIHIRMALDKKPTKYTTIRENGLRIREKDLFKYYEKDINPNQMENVAIFEIVKRKNSNFAYYYEVQGLTKEDIEEDQKSTNKYKYLVFENTLTKEEKEQIEAGENFKWDMLHRMPDGGYRNYYPQGLPIQYRKKGDETQNYQTLTGPKDEPITWENWDGLVANGLYNKFDLENNLYYFTDTTKTYYTKEYIGDLTDPNRLVDWREIIYQMAYDYRQSNKDFQFYRAVEDANPEYKDGRTGYEQYYTDIEGFWRQVYKPYTTTYTDRLNFGEYYGKNDISPYWNKKIHTDPYSLNFWFDFLDTGSGELSKFNVNKIEARTKGVNENTINSIYYKEVPEVLFIITPKEQYEEDDQMTYIPLQINENMAKLFYRSSQGISAIQRVNELVYQHTGSTETISLSCIPIYYLQPNTRIQVKGQDYTLDKITYQLTYNGTMNLSGTKIVKQFI